MKGWIDFLRRHPYLVFLGTVLRLVPSPFTGHPYDMGIWWITGELLSEGKSPYTPYDHLGQPVVLGIWMLLSYLLAVQMPFSLNVFAFLMKVPLILTDLYLPYYLLHLCDKYDLPIPVSENKLFALTFLNPLAILITGFWGMPDLLALLLVLVSVDKLLEDRWLISSVLLAFAIGIKLYPAVLTVSLMILYRWNSKSRFLPFLYGSVTVLVFLVISYFPFFIFGWNEEEITGVLTSQTNRGYGTLSPFHLLILFSYYNQSTLLHLVVAFIQQNDWLGFLWVVNSILFLFIMLVFARGVNPLRRLDISFIFAFDLMVVSYVLWMIVASWVSEQNTLPLIYLTTFRALLDENHKEVALSLLASFSVIGFAVYNLPFFRFFYMTLKPILVYTLNSGLIARRNLFLSLFGSFFFVSLLALLSVHLRNLRTIAIYWKKVI